MPHHLDPRSLETPQAVRVETVEVADDGVRRHADAGEEPGAAVGRQHDAGVPGESPVPATVGVLPVEEHDGSSAPLALCSHHTHARVSLASGNAASYARSSGHNTSAVTTADGSRYSRL